MNPILVVRSEIICLIILFFIMLYSSLYKMGKDQGNFLRICIFAIGHVVFDLITVLTVNNLTTVPPIVNRVSHIIFYIFALLYSYEFLCYIVSLCCKKRMLKQIRFFGLTPIIAYLIAVPFLPMEYLKGNGTNYSFGTAAITGYGVAMILFVASIIVVLTHLKKLSNYIIGALLPMLFTAIAAEIVQIIVPELLFTGGTVTIITVGFFFSLENPVATLRQKALIDALTGVKSRNSYEANLPIMEAEFANNSKFGMVFCDINDLKSVNDKGGHIEGDSYIGTIAQILLTCLKSSDAIYRMGGDEFLAVYKNKNYNIIKKEVDAVNLACEVESKNHDYNISVAMGFALTDEHYKSLKDVLRTADYRMYSNKASLKRQHAYLINDSENLNISGLTDRIFDAFAGTDSNRFLFVTNMSTNVTRWSRSAVEYFAMKSEFVYDNNSAIMKRIHPEDRDSFFDDINAVFTGSQKSHDLEYRILNSNGEYVNCSSSGTILHGRNGEPDLFAGSMFIRSAIESIDRLTDLRNGYEMMNYLNYLVQTHSRAALLQLSILNLSRINMLYGYICGNEILKQFATEIRNIVGDSGSVFRSDGTKIVICMPDADKNDISSIYRKIKASSEQCIHLNTIAPPLQLTAGAYVLDESFNGTGSVLRSNLIFAYDKSKYEERGRLVFYDSLPIALGNIDHKNRLISIHQDAIAGCNGFFLVYQPLVNVQSGQITGAEALLRWSKDGSDIQSPSGFIPWLEEDPCFFALGNWILKTALTEAKKVLEYCPKFTVSVNIAMTQLEHEGLRKAVLETLEETGFPANQLCLELTERCRELNIDYLKEEIEFYRSHGIQIALDDLGTGFSSFNLLLCLNVDGVKLDHAFVKEIKTKRVNQILTRMLIDASNSMGYATCLEGVENDELCNYLNNYGATYYQGYYCSKPKRIDEFIDNMKNWNIEHKDNRTT